MDEATVKNIFRQKLNDIFTAELLADSDVVDVTLLVGYRMFIQKCDSNEAIRILTEATNENKEVVDSLITYFTGFIEEQKRIAKEKEEAVKKEQQLKSEGNNNGKQDNKTKGKVLPKPKGKVQENQQGQGEVAVKFPPPQKKQKLQNGEQNPEGAQQQGGQKPVSAATQLINQGKVKCKYFPSCKNQQCIYFHPTEKCPYFPRCRFAQKCMFVHEVCKFGQNCTRNNCFYDHPFKKKSNNPMIELMKMMTGQMNTHKKPIRKRKPTQDASQKPATDKPVQQEQK